MRGAILITGILMMLLTACGAPPSTPQIVEPRTPLASATHLPPTPVPTDTQAATPTTRPPATATVPTPTETLLPPLDLPTLAVNPPVRSVWDGTPTYLADSVPGYAFRVLYDPEVWGLVTDQLGQPALGHRSIPYCIITPTQGRGLTPAMRVDHEIIYPEDLTIDVARVYQNDMLTFVTYQVSDRTVLTGFVVDFQEQSDDCLADALTVISTLRSVPLSQATPQP